MAVPRNWVLLNALKVVDMAVLVTVYLLAAVPVAHASEGISIGEFLSMRVKVENFFLFLAILCVWYIFFASFGVYESQRWSSLERELQSVLCATTACVAFAGLAALVFQIRMVTPEFLVTFWLITMGVLVLSRVALRYFLESIRKRGRNLRYMLVVGTNARAMEFAHRIDSMAQSGYRIIGFVDEPWPGLNKFLAEGQERVCDFEQLAEFLRNTVVDEVVIGLPIRSYYEQSSAIAALCELHGIVVRFLPGIFNLKLSRSRAEEFEGNSLITLSPVPLEGWPGVFKRVLDVAIATALIMLFSPLFLVVAVIIKLSSNGPVFFMQERLGLNKRTFRICKFRTMVADAERRQAALEKLNEQDGPAFKIKLDPRITAVGKFLRKTSIDELPQLFNVLDGDMSLVGPRPLPVRDYKGFDQDWHRRRFSVRPGITCLWQISGRNSIGFDKWMELDMRYIDEWSLWLDFRILAGTIPAVLRGTGAA